MAFSTIIIIIGADDGPVASVADGIAAAVRVIDGYAVEADAADGTTVALVRLMELLLQLCC